MHFLIIGATGRTGSVVLGEALERGHTVTALVRNPDKVESQEGLTLAKGTPMSASDVDAAFSAAPEKRVDAVLVALNIKRESGSPWAKPISPPDLMEKSIVSISTAMKQHGVRKLVNMSAFGVGDSGPNMPWYLRALVEHSAMGAQFADHDNAHKVVKNDDGIDWVFVRPLRLTETKKAATREYGDTGKEVSGFASISVASVASFMVAAAEASTWDRHTPVISN